MIGIQRKGGHILKVTVEENQAIEEIEVIIKCKNQGDDVLFLLEKIRTFDQKVIANRNNETYFIKPSMIMYIQVIDKSTFLADGKYVYETTMKLYELENLLEIHDFMRVNKSCIINLNQVRSMSPDLYGRIIMKMNNGEKIIVSRQYSMNIKKKLGVK